MGDEHLDTIPATKSDEFIKSCVENLVPNSSESEGKSGCDLPACFTTFSNILFDAEYEFDPVDDQLLSNEDGLEEIFSNALFEEEINSMRINQHNFNADDILIREELLDNYSLLPPENESFHFDIPSFSHPPAKPPDGNTGILNIKIMGDVSDQKVPIPEFMITRVSNKENSPDLLSHRGFENFQPSSECPMMIHGKNIPILDVPRFHFYPP
nr:hypothetical protein [Tanacetum cinerariifolium]